MMHITQHPQIVFMVIYPVADIFFGELLSVFRSTVLVPQMRQQAFIKFLYADGAGQRPFNDVMMGFQRLCAVEILLLVFESGVLYAADKTRQVKLMDELLVHLLIFRGFATFVVGRVKSDFIKPTGISMYRLDMPLNLQLILQPLAHILVLRSTRCHLTPPIATQFVFSFLSYADGKQQDTEKAYSKLWNLQLYFDQFVRHNDAVTETQRDYYKPDTSIHASH